MSVEVKSYCSWCCQLTRHQIQKTRTFGRATWQCASCQNFTVRCRACENMACAEPGKIRQAPRLKQVASKLNDLWGSQFCAEHDGSVASFENLDRGLDDIEDYEILFERKSKDLKKRAALAGAAIGGGVILGPMAMLGAPTMAAALGSGGLLGAAGTGTTISTLSGAALTSASLAAIGGGTIGGGVVLLTAAGAALGGVGGGRILNRYMRDVKGFNISKHNEGNTPQLVVSNGFLTQDSDDFRCWTKAFREQYAGHASYFVRWESKRRADIGKMVAGDLAGVGAAEFAAKIALRASRKAGKRISPLTWASIAADLLGNPWHVATVKAGMTGVMLADLLARTDGKTYTLVAHSLGARVMQTALLALSTRKKKIVQDVILLGGALDRNDQSAWQAAGKAITGKIYNCYTEHDRVLRALYRGANLFMSEPIGIDKIAFRSPKIKNVDCSDLVNGHMDWKNHLPEVLERTKEIGTSGSRGKNSKRRRKTKETTTV